MSDLLVVDRPLPSDGVDPSNILLSKNEGQAAGESVVECLNSARYSIIDAAVLVKDALDRFRQDRDALDGFIRALVGGGVVAEGDARLGERASKLSAYRKVGEHSGLLLEVLHYFDPSLYIYYDVVRLFEALGRDKRALERRLKVMAQLGVSRETLQEEIRNLKSRKRQSSTPSLSKDVVPSGSHHPIKIATGQFGLVLATPTKSDIQLLARDMADDVSAPECMRVHERTSSTAVLLVTSRIIDLPIVVRRLLPYCGFSGASHVFLLDSPKEHDVTQCKVMTVSSRGNYPIEAAKLSSAITKGHGLLTIAADLATEDDGRLHLFADHTSIGWTSIVGSANWSAGGAS